MSVLIDFRTKSQVLWGGVWVTFSTLFLFRASGTLKKVVPEGHSKLDLFLGPFWGLPGGPQEGSRVHGSSIFTFAAGPKKGSKMGATMEPFGLSNPNYTYFVAPCEKLVPKKLHRKKVAKSRG